MLRDSMFFIFAAFTAASRIRFLERPRPSLYLTAGLSNRDLSVSTTVTHELQNELAKTVPSTNDRAGDDVTRRSVAERLAVAVWANARRLLRRMGVEVHRTSSTPEAQLVQQLNYRNVDLIVDVGASVGQYARGLRRLGYLGKILSFEPLEDCHRILTARASRDPNWDVALPMALGSERGRRRIIVSHDRVSSSFLVPTTTLLRAAQGRPRSAASHHVQVSTLSDELLKRSDRARRMFVKVDVQGTEAEVLAGASDVLDMIVGFQVEVSLKKLYKGQNTADEVMKFLDVNGYELTGVIPGLVDRARGEMLQMDVIYMRRDVC